MKFGSTLKRSIYGPWKENYLDYSKLKELLRDKESEAGIIGDWTEHEEGKFVDELVNVQLERVATFQKRISSRLQERVLEVEKRLEKVARVVNGENAVEDADGEEGSSKVDEEEAVTSVKVQSELRAAGQELEVITDEVKELEKYCRINYTGFLKAAKKHDRIRGAKYKVRTLLQIRLAELPFNTEDYSPLLYRISIMISFVRQHDSSSDITSQSAADSREGETRYLTRKYWVHKDNLLEVKSYILRRLPVLMYNPQSSKIAESSQGDPTLTSIYFDNPELSLYTDKVDKVPNASSLRLRWYGSLEDQPEIHVEKKIMIDDDLSEETRLTLKPKHVAPFLAGEYKKEKEIQKLKAQSERAAHEAEKLEKTVSQIQNFIKEQKLQPILRATYSRSAFQIPGDDRVRISIDTNLALIREDALDPDRPCRDPSSWHRLDIDSPQLSYPFPTIRQGEISRFPHALLELKTSSRISARALDWLQDLTSGHLLTEAPRFSKFVHGVATLLEDRANVFPFWLAELDRADIRRDPQAAFVQAQERAARQAEDEFAVGSFLRSAGTPRSPARFGISHQDPAATAAAVSSSRPGKSLSLRRLSPAPIHDADERPSIASQMQDPYPATDMQSQQRSKTAKILSSLLPSFSTSKYARRHRAFAAAAAAAVPDAPLPPGVRRPSAWLNDAGPVQVEPKVWLANQRTFIKWQHNAVLMASLGLVMLNVGGGGGGGQSAGSPTAGPAGPAGDGTGAPVRQGGSPGQLLAAALYTVVALGIALWALRMYEKRGRMIRRRDPGHFDDRIGPVVVAVVLGTLMLADWGMSLGRRSMVGDGGGGSGDGGGGGGGGGMEGPGGVRFATVGGRGDL